MRLSSGLQNVVPGDRSFSITWEFAKADDSGPTADVLNQKLWVWAGASMFLTSPPRDSAVPGVWDPLI